MTTVVVRVRAPPRVPNFQVQSDLWTNDGGTGAALLEGDDQSSSLLTSTRP